MKKSVKFANASTWTAVLAAQSLMSVSALAAYETPIPVSRLNRQVMLNGQNVKISFRASAYSSGAPAAADAANANSSAKAPKSRGSVRNLGEIGIESHGCVMAESAAIGEAMGRPNVKLGMSLLRPSDFRIEFVDDQSGAVQPSAQIVDEARFQRNLIFFMKKSSDVRHTLVIRFARKLNGDVNDPCGGGRATADDIENAFNAYLGTRNYVVDSIDEFFSRMSSFNSGGSQMAAVNGGSLDKPAAPIPAAAGAAGAAPAAAAPAAADVKVPGGVSAPAAS